MKDYIFNTTNEKIDTTELDSVINFACKHLGIKNPLLNIVIRPYYISEDLYYIYFS